MKRLMTRVRTAPAVIPVLVVVLLLGAATALALKGTPDRPADHDAGWQWMHGRAYVDERSRCQGCHDDMDCKTCHLADYPHPDGWQSVHGTEALERDGRGCSLCHRSSFCDPCHGGIAMPHPEGFLAEHTALSAESCARCHVPSDCSSCHQSHAAHRAGGMVFP